MTGLSIYDTGAFAPCPDQFNMAAHTFALSGSEPEHTALEVLSAPGVVSEHWTHGSLTEAVLRTAGGMRAMGIGRADRVLLRVGNSSDFPILFFAANALGAVPVPSSATLTPTEVAAIISDLEPSLICLGAGLDLPDCGSVRIAGPGEIESMRTHDPVPFAKTHADDPAFMVYTSGTSSRPKGVVHAQRAAWARRMMWDGWYGLRSDDRVLHAGAFNWTYTLGAGLTDPWAKGAAALIYCGPQDREVWPALATAHKATLFAAAPGVYRQMLGADLSNGFADLRHGLCAGEALPSGIAANWSGATGKPIFQALGMSEISTYISFSPDHPAKPGRAGYPQPGRRISVLGEETGQPVPIGQDGLLAVSRRDPGLMLEYWKRPEETASAFRGEWFLTGDRARMEEDHAIVWLGRADDLMNAGGFRVDPAEVEAVLLSHPGIAEAAVVETEVRSGVSVISAFYVLHSDHISETWLQDHCAQSLAHYKCPRVYHAVEELPKSSNGKILRRNLREGSTVS